LSLLHNQSNGDKEMIFKTLLLLGAILFAHAYDVCSPGESGTFYRDYSTCQSYFACSDGTTYSGKCPKDYLFNANKSACDFPYNVKCDLECPKNGTTAFRLPDSCTKYISCAKGKGTYMECPEESIFDSKSKTCGSIEKVKCPFGGMCPDPRVENLIASKEKCSGYYKCKKGKPVLLECEHGLHFNAAKKICDKPANAKCPIVTNKEEEVSDVTISCPTSGSFFYPHPLDCSLYYVCHNGKSTIMNCGHLLRYDFLSQTCNLPSQSKCIVDYLKLNTESKVDTSNKNATLTVEQPKNGKKLI